MLTFTYLIQHAESSSHYIDKENNNFLFYAIRVMLWMHTCSIVLRHIRYHQSKSWENSKHYKTSLAQNTSVVCSEPVKQPGFPLSECF